MNLNRTKKDLTGKMDVALQIRRSWSSWLILLAGVCTLGCGSRVPQFEPNRLASMAILGDQSTQDPNDRVKPEAYQQMADVLYAMFGNPDAPHFMKTEGSERLLQLDHLNRSAGPVNAEGEGLYRRHCVHCHGITGNGKGPTAAFLNPYPRDFTKGIFKFHSSQRGTPPTNEDLHKILNDGIDGTAMPSFALLPRGEREALIDYVKYLAIRGQMERDLLSEIAETGEIVRESSNLVEDKLGSNVAKWNEATPVAPPEPKVPLFTQDREGWNDDQLQQLYDSIGRGRTLYYTSTANCFSCHGPTQLGDGTLDGYDDWTKEPFDWATLTKPELKQTKLQQFKALGGLTPRYIRPRNLRVGQYRGGRRPVDLYWRIIQGIEGTPMPAAAMKPEGIPDAPGLTQDDIWDIVNFVLSLPYEKLSRPDVDLPANGRMRS